jgi:hypothetical protein
MRYRGTSTVSAYSGVGSSGGGGAHFAAAVRHARSPGHVFSLGLTDGSLDREYSILIPRIALPEIETYSAEELGQLFGACTAAERLTFQFFLGTGCREREVMFA